MRKFCLADKTVNSFVIAVYMPMMCWRNGVLVNWKNDDLLSDAGHCSSSAPAAKYVFYFIGDGMGICQVFGTELFMNLSEDDRDEKLAFTSFPVKSIITTHSASSLVTDSAAAGTALACGAKTNNDMLGVDPEGAELISLADLAKHEGYATGVVSNVAVNHATPGAFYAHQSDRLDYEAISRDLLDWYRKTQNREPNGGSERAGRPESMYVTRPMRSGAPNPAASSCCPTTSRGRRSDTQSTGRTQTWNCRI